MARVVSTENKISTEHKKRIVRRLVRGGRGFAEAYGLRVTNNPASLFQVLCLAVLLRRHDTRQAVAAVVALRERGWDSPARMARSLHPARARVLRDAGWRRGPDELATVLGDLAVEVAARYRGDLRRLRVAARYQPDAERRLLGELPGVDDEVVQLFLRETQALWREVAPVVDRRALAAARRLGLARSSDDLAELAGAGASEKLAWLVGALARIDAQDAHHDVDR